MYKPFVNIYLSCHATSFYVKNCFQERLSLFCMLNFCLVFIYFLVATMQVNVLTHTATVTPSSEHCTRINYLKMLHKVQDQNKLLGVVGENKEKTPGNNHVESQS